MHWIYTLAQMVRNHLSEISFTLTTMFFVVCGPYINKGLKGMAEHLHWLIRYGLFVLLATVGYGIMTHYGFGMVRRALSGLPNLTLLSVVIGAHLLMAWLLKRENSI